MVQSELILKNNFLSWSKLRKRLLPFKPPKDITQVPKRRVFRVFYFKLPMDSVQLDRRINDKVSSFRNLNRTETGTGTLLLSGISFLFFYLHDI